MRAISTPRKNNKRKYTSRRQQRRVESKAASLGHRSLKRKMTQEKKSKFKNRGNLNSNSRSRNLMLQKVIKRKKYHRKARKKGG